MSLKPYLDKCLSGESLTSEEAAHALETIMTGAASDVQTAALLVALRCRGETVEEIEGFARTMRNHAVTVHVEDTHAIDVCGTGGDGTGTFNISTTAAFIAAGAGVTVAKHGNRSISSKSGSADVLRALGINVECSPARTAEALHAIGIGFLFAPLYHPSMKHVAKVRAELATKTIFNILGPLTNPARVQYQVIGANDKAVASKMIAVLKNLGSKRALTFHSRDGADEVTLTGEADVFELLPEGRTSTYTASPSAFAFENVPPDSLAGGTAEENAGILLSILQGERSPRRDVAVANAALGLYVAGKAADLREARVLAEDSIDSLRAIGKLERLKELTNRP